jgi:hypothetical protein
LKGFIQNRELNLARPLSVGIALLRPTPLTGNNIQIGLRHPEKNTPQNFQNEFLRPKGSAIGELHWSGKKNASPPASRCLSQERLKMAGTVLAAAAESQKNNFRPMREKETDYLAIAETV